jgi:hypothetical protein
VDDFVLKYNLSTCKLKPDGGFQNYSKLPRNTEEEESVYATTQDMDLSLMTESTVQNNYE